MPAPFDYPRFFAETADTGTPDPDEVAARARARPAHRPRRRFRLPSWITEVHRTSVDGLSTPTLRDYPWPSGDRV